MADSTAGGYNPGASMLNANPDVSLKVFMGGGADADGGAGMAYNDTASLLRTVPGVELQKFDGGAMRVPGAEGQGRLLQDVLGITEVRKEYEEKNNVIRSLDDLRGAFREPGRYEEFIDWLGGKLLNNDLFKNFVKERMLTIGTQAAAPRAKRRTRDQIIADALQKSIAKIADAQAELARLQTVKEGIDERLKAVAEGPQKQKQIEEIEKQKKATLAQIVREQDALTKTITQSTAIPTMQDAELEALADGTGKRPARQVAPKPAVASEGAVSDVVASTTPVPVVPSAPSAPPAIDEGANKDEVASSTPVPTPASPGVGVNQLEQGVSSAPVPPPFGTVGSPPNLVGNPTNMVSSEPLLEQLGASTTSPATSITPVAPEPVTKGGARKAKRTLKSRTQKGRGTLKRK